MWRVIQYAGLPTRLYILVSSIHCFYLINCERNICPSEEMTIHTRYTVKQERAQEKHFLSPPLPRLTQNFEQNGEAKYEIIVVGVCACKNTFSQRIREADSHPRVDQQEWCSPCFSLVMGLATILSFALTKMRVAKALATPTLFNPGHSRCSNPWDLLMTLSMQYVNTRKFKHGFWNLMFDGLSII